MPTFAVQSTGALFSGASTAATVSSSAIDVGPNMLVGFQIRTSAGDSVGSVKVEGSIDGSNWNTLNLTDGVSIFTAVAIAAGVTNDNLIFAKDLAVRWLRCTYTRTSGSTSTLSVTTIRKYHGSGS